ncbi:ATP-binding cassette domain-containing protein [Tsukamurella sp. 8F]|uniref:ABC-F family ATP-binding cassette domain-containing protein n=1 Tax=unclassified Tsukamurella TaxID=2633480 RepID=UPI0023B9CCF6|nr:MULTISPECIES: ATP-binding cassette domain-containing protein [unclassified Tsukamurella]MDF0531485.1 ATP-binding cassette domain-containing protein [Tsukamurella sp. 8J]MDF0588729.1 ATP-binding cassette domain-containing protein [Tsukamurella sp. 8F]
MSTSPTVSALSFSWPDGTPVLRDVSFTVPAGRASLVGANGAGKSTLLRLLAGQLTPTSGSISDVGIAGYVPQRPQARPAAPLAEALGVSEPLNALRRIEAGSTDSADFDAVGEDWDVAERAAATLDGLGLARLGGATALDRPLGTLSGGEATLVAIAGRLLQRPDTLLLDEPTNNLDARARGLLVDALQAFAGSVLVVSHDLELLERMSATVELYRGRVRVFGGPYSHYREVLAAEQAAAEQAVVTARDDLRIQRRQLAENQTKLARRARTARKAEAEKRVPKIVAGLRKNAAEVSAGKLKNLQEDRVDAARDALDAAGENVRDDRAVRISLPEPGPTGRGPIIDLDDPCIGRLRIDAGDRVALAGPNGTGKTTLLRAGLDDATTRGRAVGYVPQDLHFPDESASLIDCVMRPARFAPDSGRGERPDLGAEPAHAALARMLFRGRQSERTVGSLSGGERLRLALALALLPDPAPTLLALDEPTNNLDVPSVELLVEALDDWKGALVIVSHDAEFIRRLRITRRIELSE